MFCCKRIGLIPPGSGTSQTGRSWCVGEGVHLLECGGWFPALTSSVAERMDNILKRRIKLCVHLRHLMWSSDVHSFQWMLDHVNDCTHATCLLDLLLRLVSVTKSVLLLLDFGLYSCWTLMNKSTLVSIGKKTNISL